MENRYTPLQCLQDIVGSFCIRVFACAALSRSPRTAGQDQETRPQRWECSAVGPTSWSLQPSTPETRIPKRSNLSPAGFFLLNSQKGDVLIVGDWWVFVLGRPRVLAGPVCCFEDRLETGRSRVGFHSVLLKIGRFAETQSNSAAIHQYQT